MFELIQDYKNLFERRMEGLLLGEGTTMMATVPFSFLFIVYSSY